MNDPGTIKCELRDSVARLIVCNPARLNVLTLHMLAELDRAIAGIAANAAIRMVQLEGDGDRYFSAGAHIGEWGELSPEAMGRQWIREGNRVLRRLLDLDAVVICVLNGDALGGGLELALASDFRLAVEGARLGFPEVGIGAIPGWLGCARLQELIGPGRAREMILTGLPIDAVQAERWGLVNQVLPRTDVRDRLREIVDRVAHCSPIAIGAAKRLLNAGLDAERWCGMHELAATACLASPDAVEGLAAFRSKRQPVFPAPRL